MAMELAAAVGVEVRLISGEILAELTMTLGDPIRQVRAEISRFRRVSPASLSLIQDTVVLNDADLLRDHCIMLPHCRIALTATIGPPPCMDYADCSLEADLIMSQTMSIQEAKEMAVTLPQCKGFCFKNPEASKPRECDQPQHVEEAIVEVFFVASFRPTFRPGWSSLSVYHPDGAAKWKVARAVRGGEIIIASGRPCKVTEHSSHKPGGKGGGPYRSKIMLRSVDMFTSQLFDDFGPSVRYIEVPFAEKSELEVSSIDACSGHVVVLDDSGVQHSDLKLPTYVLPIQVTAEDRRVTRDIVDAYLAGERVNVIVFRACGMEKVVGCRVLSCGPTEVANAIV